MASTDFKGTHVVSLWLPTGGGGGETELHPRPLKLDDEPEGQRVEINGVEYTLEVLEEIERDPSRETVAYSCLGHPVPAEVS